MVHKDCGKHWGDKPGPCSKCGYFAKLESDPKYRAGIQYGGTPFIAALEPAPERTDLTQWQAWDRPSKGRPCGQ